MSPKFLMKDLLKVTAYTLRESIGIPCSVDTANQWDDVIRMLIHMSGNVKCHLTAHMGVGVLYRDSNQSSDGGIETAAIALHL